MILHQVFQILGRSQDWFTLRLLASFGRMSPEILPQFRGHQLRALLALTPIMMIANIVNGTAFALLQLNEGRMSTLDAAWLLLVYYLSSHTIWRYLKRRNRSPVAAPHTIGKLILSSALLGIVWSYPLSIIAGGAYENNELAFISALTAGMIAGGSIALYPVPLAAIMYVGIISVLVPQAIIAGAPSLAIPFSMITGMYFVIVVVSLLRHHAIFLRDFHRRILAEAQKEVLDLLIGNNHDRTDSCIWQSDQNFNLLTSSTPIKRIVRAEDQTQTKNLLELLKDFCVENEEDLPRGRLDELASWFHGDFRESNFETRFTTRSDPARILLFAARRVVQPLDQAVYYNGYIRDITNEAAAQAEVLRLATLDSLTGLPNHTEFLRRASQSLADAASRSSEFLPCVFFLDADNLKWINDEFGHQVGDVLLRSISDTLKQFSGNMQVLCRKGGDEFLVFSVFSSERAVVLASKNLTKKLNGEFDCGGRRLQRRCTVGVAYCHGLEKDVLTLEAEADTALKAQKKQSKSSVGYYTRDIADSQRRGTILIRDIRRAISREELYLEYQPIISSGGRTVVAAEALIRWKHPELGQISPLQIVDVAAAEGVSDQLTAFVLSSAILESKHWPSHMNLSVNVSAGQFSMPDFWTSVVVLTKRHCFNAERLWIEVTERELFPESEVALQNVERLRQAGMKLVLDDFGAGYSSLHVLESVDWDIIKVDRSVVLGCYRRPASLTMIRAICEIATQSGRQVVIEGIEDERDLRAVGAFGHIMFQGFLFERPTPKLRVSCSRYTPRLDGHAGRENGTVSGSFFAAERSTGAVSTGRTVPVQLLQEEL